VGDPLPRVKEPHLAGRWYPADPAALAARVRALLAAAGGARRGVRAVVAPHAPLAHAGAVAAAAHAAATPPRRAIVLGPTHYASFSGACTLPVAGYRTPLGVMAVDGAAVEALVRAGAVRTNPAVFMREHAVEAQLPFLQARAPEATLVPLLVGTLAPGEAAALAAALHPLLDADTLLVVSSDLVHYGRRHGFLPVPPADAAAVRAALGPLDDAAVAHLAAGDADAFVRWLETSGAPVCGRHALEACLRALPGVRGECVARGSSLDATGAWDTVIGWGALVFGGDAA
jgi:AmmeMemoRadiSam system protein B